MCKHIPSHTLHCPIPISLPFPAHSVGFPHPPPSFPNPSFHLSISLFAAPLRQRAFLLHFSLCSVLFCYPRKLSFLSFSLLPSCSPMRDFQHCVLSLPLSLPLSRLPHSGIAILIEPLHLLPFSSFIPSFCCFLGKSPSNDSAPASQSHISFCSAFLHSPHSACLCVLSLPSSVPLLSSFHLIFPLSSLEQAGSEPSVRMGHRLKITPL